MAVDAPRDPAVVDGDGRLAQDLLDGQHPFREPDVGQLGMGPVGGGDEVAHREHAILARTQPLVDGDEAAPVDLNARSRSQQALRAGAAAHGDHHGVDGDLLAVAEADGRPVLPGRVSVDLDPGAHLDAAPLEGAAHDLGHVAVTAGDDPGKNLEHGDLRAQVAHHRRELAADGPGADDDHRGGKPLEVEQLVRGQHHPSVDLEAGQGPGHRPRGQDDMVALQLPSVVQADLAPGQQRARSREDGVLAGPHQALQALPQTVHDLLLAGLAGGEVHGGLLGLDAELLGPGHGPVHRCRLQELLGRDAAAVQAGPAHLLALDHGHRQPRVPPVERGRVAAGPASDDHDVVLLGRGDHLLARLTHTTDSSRPPFLLNGRQSPPARRRRPGWRPRRRGRR